jgi:hypothetical protein
MGLYSDIQAAIPLAARLALASFLEGPAFRPAMPAGRFAIGKYRRRG